MPHFLHKKYLKQVSDFLYWKENNSLEEHITA